MLLLILSEDFKRNDSSVIATSAPNFSNSVLRATNLSVSLIFKVCKPVNLHSKPKPNAVTEIVCAISGAFLKSNSMILLLSVFSTFFKLTELFSKLVSTPNSLYNSDNTESP